jgi:hypothetical protein
MRELDRNKRSHENRLKYFFVLVLALALAGQVSTAYATPSAPVLLVNKILKQCIEGVILSDECYVCKPEKGWEISQTSKCPSGYEIIPRNSINDLPLNCAEYPKMEWPPCSSGRFPTMTPDNTVPMEQQPAIDKSNATVTTPVFLVAGSILGVSIIGIAYLVTKRRSK